MGSLVITCRSLQFEKKRIKKFKCEKQHSLTLLARTYTLSSSCVHLCCVAAGLWGVTFQTLIMTKKRGTGMNSARVMSNITVPNNPANPTPLGITINANKTVGGKGPLYVTA